MFGRTHQWTSVDTWQIGHTLSCSLHGLWSIIASSSSCGVQEGEHFLGMFSQESAAARACDVAALKLHGASATTNFPARSDCVVHHDYPHAICSAWRRIFGWLTLMD